MEMIQMYRQKDVSETRQDQEWEMMACNHKP